MAIKTLLISALAATGVHAAGEALAWASSGDGKIRLREIEPPVLGRGNLYELRGWEMRMKDLTGLKQKVRGFGATVTEATVEAFGRLNDTARENLLKDLLTSDGINLRFMRIANGSYDDFGHVLTGNEHIPDAKTRNFELGDRGRATAKLLSEMRRVQKDIKIVASPRPPPRWMRMEVEADKLNRNNTYPRAYGEYLSDYLDEFAKAGAPIDVLTIQTEPIHDKKKVQETKGYLTAENVGKLLRTFIVPALKKAGQKTKIWVYGSNTIDYEFAKDLVTATKDIIQGIAWHCYTGGGTHEWKALRKMDKDTKGLPEQFVTECWTAKGETDWRHTLNYILIPVQNRMSGVIIGALATYPQGGPVPPGDDACFSCTGIITIDPDTGTYTKEVDYYLLGQFSRYIPTADVRIADMKHSELLGDGSGIRGIGTVNFGKGGRTRTVVIQSRFDKDIWLQLTTESDKKMWNGRVIANGVTTWVLPPGVKKRPK